jgi:hypothetical protein|tara:strand:+ start:8401 stop:8511 length:111 start_codon:yes stop_codon:yes gene_type:complete
MREKTITETANRIMIKDAILPRMYNITEVLEEIGAL